MILVYIHQYLLIGVLVKVMRWRLEFLSLYFDLETCSPLHTFFRFRIDLSMIDTQIQHDKINDSKNPYIYIDIEVVEDRTTLSYFSWAMNLANKLCFNIFYLFENKEYEKMDKILGVNNVQHFALTFVYYQQYSYIYHQHSIMKWIWTLGTFIYMSYVS